MRTLSVATGTHGRVLVDDPSAGPAAGVVLAFHGYGQAAEDALADVRLIPGAGVWTVAAVQGLHRFYTRRDTRVVASWMTRQDRDAAIADNVAYVDRVVEDLDVPAGLPIVCLGFSQGVAMAYRAARAGRRPVHGIMAIAGDLPPELGTSAGGTPAWPPVFVAAGDQDQWYTAGKLEADLTRLATCGAAVTVCRFHGGHAWTAELREAAARWLAARVPQVSGRRGEAGEP